jgi:hypothetical protein
MQLVAQTHSDKVRLSTSKPVRGGKVMAKARSAGWISTKFQPQMYFLDPGSSNNRRTSLGSIAQGIAKAAWPNYHRHMGAGVPPGLLFRLDCFLLSWPAT